MRAVAAPCNDVATSLKMKPVQGEERERGRHLSPGGFTGPPNPPGAAYLQGILLYEIIECPEHLGCGSVQLKRS